MKTTEKNKRTMLEELRDIREKISAETQHMTFAELKKYLDARLQKSLHANAVWT